MQVKTDLSEAVRRYAVEKHVRQAKRGGTARFRITAGEVHRALGFHNRVPVVCSALRSEKFLRENGLRLVETSGPPSGQSTTVTYTYEFQDLPSHAKDPLGEVFKEAYGCAKDVYAQFGGGEAYLRAERASWNKEPER